MPSTADTVAGLCMLAQLHTEAKQAWFASAEAATAKQDCLRSTAVELQSFADKPRFRHARRCSEPAADYADGPVERAAAMRSA